MMFELKTLSKSSIAAALAKAERYRLLNEPEDAESICLDVLAIDADNREAVVSYILALTEQFDSGLSGKLEAAKQSLAQLKSEYEREYYAGLINERRAKSALRSMSPACGTVAYEWIRKAMIDYERAEKLQPQGNDDAMLRWNTCARLIMKNPKVRPDDTTLSTIESE